MKISDIRVRMVKTESSKIKAIVSITIDDSIVVHDIKVIERKDDGTLFIAMPSRKNSEGEFRDVVHPANTESREMLKDLVIKAYEEELKNAQ